MNHEISQRIESARIAHEDSLEYYAKYKPAIGQKTLEEHWITLRGGGEGSGTHVQVDKDGNITAGPAALAAKGIKNMSDFGKGHFAASATQRQKETGLSSLSHIALDKLAVEGNKAERELAATERANRRGERTVPLDPIEDRRKEHEMTRKEFLASPKGQAWTDKYVSSTKSGMLDHGAEPNAVHRSAVKNALQAGQQLRPEVLADYPDLVKKPEATDAASIGSKLEAELQKNLGSNGGRSMASDQRRAFMKDYDDKAKAAGIEKGLDGWKSSAKPESEQHNPTKPQSDDDAARSMAEFTSDARRAIWSKAGFDQKVSNRLALTPYNELRDEDKKKFAVASQGFRPENKEHADRLRKSNDDVSRLDRALEPHFKRKELAKSAVDEINQAINETEAKTRDYGISYESRQEAKKELSKNMAARNRARKKLTAVDADIFKIQAERNIAIADGQEAIKAMKPKP